ncbi:alpha/beta fold hydrolase [Anaerosporobacter faecicola]|uniref:alpha/beta fold hydrolase n=1 Tax=Anaerosporobacter faecicola TaxID=2718714 RepID=UPI00143A0932|nr:alpha/beta fold hydrolase [Anaerosporobacter faecicola]
MKKNKKVSIALFTTAAVAAFTIFINKLTFYLAAKQDKLYLPNSNYYEWRFGKIYFTKHGQGEPVLLVHDLDASQSSYEFKTLISRLEKNYTVYTIDLIGFGKSDKPKITYTNFLFVQLLSDFIQHVVKQKVNLICVGKSTTIGLTVCNYNPTIINKLLFINAPSITTLNKIPQQKQRLLKKLYDSYIIGNLLYNITYSKKSLASNLENQVWTSSSITKNYILSRNEAAHLSGELSRYVESSIRCYYTNLNIIHALKSINNSISFITGSEYVNYQEVFDSYYELNSSIETSIIEKAKGLPWIENPEELYQLITIFFS